MPAFTKQKKTYTSSGARPAGCFGKFTESPDESDLVSPFFMVSKNAAAQR
jgi:hypothetical protein